MLFNGRFGIGTGVNQWGGLFFKHCQPLSIVLWQAWSIFVGVSFASIQPGHASPFRR
jgi:hypothetical protein